MVMIVYWSSGSKNTERFVNKLSYDSCKIHKDMIVSEKFVLFCPTYADGMGNHAVPKPVIRFLNEEQNRNNMIGVVGMGNRNFGSFFGLASDVISMKTGVPILAKIELAGTQYDVDNIENILKQLRLNYE